MRLLSLLLLLLSYTTHVHAQAEREIREVLANQVECWNDGDLECFMDGYWRSDNLVFIGSSGLTYGWETTLENYKKRYPSREAMGTLTFDLNIIEPLSEEFWFVAGKFNLERKNDNPTGYFTLIFRLIDDQWVIVSDHTG